MSLAKKENQMIDCVFRLNTRFSSTAIEWDSVQQNIISLYQMWAPLKYIRKYWPRVELGERGERNYQWLTAIIFSWVCTQFLKKLL